MKGIKRSEQPPFLQLYKESEQQQVTNDLYELALVSIQIVIIISTYSGPIFQTLNNFGPPINQSILFLSYYFERRLRYVLREKYIARN